MTHTYRRLIGMTTPVALPLPPRRFASLCVCLRPLVGLAALYVRLSSKGLQITVKGLNLPASVDDENTVSLLNRDADSKGWKKHPNTRR